MNFGFLKVVCSNMPKVMWIISFGFCSKFHTLSSSANILKSVKV